MKKKQSNNTATTQISRRGRRTVQIYPQADGRTLIVVTPVTKKAAKVKPAAKPKKPAKPKPVTVKALPKPVKPKALPPPSKIKALSPPKAEPTPSGREYVYNHSTQKIELRFDKSEYQALTEAQKKDIKSNYLFSNREQAWVSRAKVNGSATWRAEKVARELGFSKGSSVGTATTFGEQQAIKEDKATARAARYDGYAENADKRAERLQSEFNRNRGDWAWITQPVISGHKGSQTFGKQRQKVLDKYERGFKEMDKADYFGGRAESARATAENARAGKSGYSLAYLQKKVRDGKHAIERLNRQIDKARELIPQVKDGKSVPRRDGSQWTVAELNEFIRDCKAQNTYTESEVEYYGGYLQNKNGGKHGKK